jgi:hypothetical protein
MLMPCLTMQMLRSEDERVVFEAAFCLEALLTCEEGLKWVACNCCVLL